MEQEFCQGVYSDTEKTSRKCGTAFVAALLSKVHYQNVYRLELGEASEVLDSLVEMMREE